MKTEKETTTLTLKVDTSGLTPRESIISMVKISHKKDYKEISKKILKALKIRDELKYYDVELKVSVKIQW